MARGTESIPLLITLIAFLVPDEEQKGMPEEDIKSKKLIQLLRDAFHLVMRIESRLEEKENLISNLYTSQKKLMSSLMARKARSQKGSPLASHERGKSNESERGKSAEAERKLFNYKSIMCPLRDRCPDDVRPRWPNTETKSISKLGSGCPYAHHYSELHFA